MIPLAGEEEAVFAVENKSVALPGRDIKIWIYRPNDQQHLPAVLYFHGGGFYKGSLDSHDRSLRQLANLSGIVVIAVDYRLAPEYRFPNGFNDCLDITKWVFNQAAALRINNHRIAVAGDSGGGTLATLVAAKVPNLVCQVLIYPATDPSFSTPSWKELADGPGWAIPKSYSGK
ncbi:alpha/beta hydrolase [Chitinophaga qingshengii]|uniref:Alpha/beta hydrolase n=1 Tax=Chitinophaga qingshengii TaxID=1569794 RepID=A0ABR7TMR0_9BACT|nr:alpha/beta hydrolase [Chitinophaga qingshengii]MBC9931772.1 alpha/beta hydrolase [Chitinophaga qingshengii]